MRKQWSFLGISIIYLLISSVGFCQDQADLVETALDVIDQVGQQSFNAMRTNEAKGSEIKINETIASFDVKGEPLAHVLDMVAARTGLVFIIPEPVHGRVTLFMEDVSVWDLLTVILYDYDLAYSRTNGMVHIMRKSLFENRYGYPFAVDRLPKIIPVRYASLEPLYTALKVAKSPEGRVWVDPKNRQIVLIDTDQKIAELQKIVAAQDVFLMTKEFDLRYVPYEMIRNDLSGLLSKDVGRIEYRSAEKKIVVTDTEENIKAIGLLLEKKDQRIVIPFRVRVMRVALSEEHEQGIDWEAIVSDYQEKVLQTDEPSVGEKATIRLGTVTQEDYEILVDALDAVGDVTHLIAFDFKPALNQESTLDVDTNDVFWSLRPGILQGKEGPVVLDPNGLEMKMRCLLSKTDDQMLLDMMPRLHWMDDEGPEVLDNNIFISPEQIRLAFSRKDVIVIGGLIRTEEITRMRKFPLLGDIPVVGTVFRREGRRYNRIEYIICLMPVEPQG